MFSLPIRRVPYHNCDVHLVLGKWCLDIIGLIHIGNCRIICPHKKQIKLANMLEYYDLYHHLKVKTNVRTKKRGGQRVSSRQYCTFLFFVW